MSGQIPAVPIETEPQEACDCDNCPDGCTCDTCVCDDCTCSRCSHSA